MPCYKKLDVANLHFHRIHRDNPAILTRMLHLYRQTNRKFRFFLIKIILFCCCCLPLIGKIISRIGSICFYLWFFNRIQRFYSPLSVGDPNVKLLRLELKWYGLGDGGTGVDSSTGRHVSTIASRQFTNNSDDSPIMLYCGKR